jgi:hypothetical protein
VKFPFAEYLKSKSYRAKRERRLLTRGRNNLTLASARIAIPVAFPPCMVDFRLAP